MCGITGFYEIKTARKRSEMQAIGKEMTARLLHRGPDAGDVWQDPDSPVLLGHRRLSIQDVSSAGAQPMLSASERYVIIYNGEIYNAPALQTEMEEAGISFRGHSDTEVFLAAIERWGLNQALQKINGMFAFALWDRKEKQLHLVRDRLGKKPLYVGWAGGSLVFGSELKSLRAHPDFKAAIDAAALALYLRYASVPAPHCIYAGIWSVPAGHRLTIQARDVQAGDDLSTLMQPYWRPCEIAAQAHNVRAPKSDAAALAVFEELLGTCVSERLLSDVPLGAFLSGGIDSSSIVAMMQARTNAQVKTYTIGFAESGYNEADYARKVAQHLETDHHEMTVSESDALALIPSLAEMYDEPFADISAIPTALLCKFARGDVTVALSGDGGDEMLGGYNRHIEAPRLWNKIGRFPPKLRAMAGKAISSVGVQTWDKILPMRPQAGTAMHKMAALMPLEDERAVYERLIRHWDEPPVKGGGTAPDLPIYQQDTKGLSFAEQMMLWDTTGYLPNDILVKVDRASMATSLEVRAPLLDPRIFQFAWSLEMQQKIRGGSGKWLLKELLKKYVPADLFERPKQGFAMPVGQWLRGELRDWAEDLLSEERLNATGVLDPAPIRACWEAHLRGAGHHATKLWTVLMFMAWYKRWM
jgi:asparagine synthase (glutamine-hydrolysing)